jgi:hypothetical protein
MFLDMKLNEVLVEMRRVIVLTMIALFFASVTCVQDLFSDSCTDVYKACGVYSNSYEKCTVGLYSTNFTSTPSAGEGTPTYLPGIPGQSELNYCGRLYQKVLGVWVWSGQGCGGLVPDNNCD